MPSPIDIQIFRNLTGIAAEWRELFSRCTDATPFQSPSWLLPWWHFFGRGDPLVIAARAHNRLAGLGLFYIYDGDSARGAQLFFVGQSASDYLDILVADGEQRAEIAQRVFDCLFEYAGEWDCADLQRIRTQSPLLDIKPPLGIGEQRIADIACPELHLQGSPMREFVSKNTRNALRKHLNRARTLGKVEFVNADQTSFEWLFTNLVRFHSARWRTLDQPGVFPHENMIAFLAEAGKQLLERGSLHLQAMLLDGTPVAVAFGMLHRKRHYFYLCDFDPDYGSISPGTLVTAYAIEQVANRGAEHFDFLRGEEKYKQQKWRAQPRKTWRIQYRCNSRRQNSRASFPPIE